MAADRYGAIVNSGHLQAPRDDFATPAAAAAWARTEAAALIAANPAGWGAEWRVHRLVGSQTALDPHPSTALLRSCDCTARCGDDPGIESGKADRCTHLQQRRTAERVIEQRQARIAELTASLGEPGDVLAALEVALESRGQLLDAELAKDGAYLERNRLVAALASCYPAGTARTAIEGWAPEWHGCVYIDLPTGQASWHYHESQHTLFAHLPPYAGTWDGHSTEQKYERLARLHGARPAIEAYMHRQAALEEALRVVMRTLETPQEAIMDVIWAEGPAHETLYEFCSTILGDDKPTTEANLPLLDPLSKAAAWNLVRRAARDLAPGRGISELLGAVDAFGQACEREAAPRYQRVPVALQLGVAATKKGATVCLIQPDADGSRTVIYSGEHPIGDTTTIVRLAATPQPEREPLSQAITDVLAERWRQISAEGYSRQHDADLHDSNDLARAAACYATAEVAYEYGRTSWPWDEEAYKPKDRYRNFVRGAALLIAAAELEALRTPKQVAQEGGAA